MKASISYGALLAVLYVVLDKVDNSLAWAAFWAIATALLTIYTAVVWRRTRLLLFAVAGGDAALTSAALCLASVAGYTLRNLPSRWMMIFWINGGVLVLAQLLSQYVLYRAQCRRWREHMEPLSLGDMLLFRHIPVLR